MGYAKRIILFVCGSDNGKEGSFHRKELIRYGFMPASAISFLLIPVNFST